MTTLAIDFPEEVFFSSKYTRYAFAKQSTKAVIDDGLARKCAETYSIPFRYAG